MLCVNDGLFIKLIGSFSALVTVILLLLAECRGQSLGVGPAQTIVTLLGEDVNLPCHLEPAADVFSKSVEWGRPDLEPRFVHVWHEGKNFLVSQNPSYKGRTSLSIENLRQGDLSLRLSAVKLSDNGMYRCYFPSQDKTSTVELVVGSVSSPVIAGININSSGVVLQCESKGWYPEPEVVWLDGEGNLLSAGPIETVRGPDDLYTVSSRVTVEKRHSNSFTCRVQQKDINQTREIEIQVSADYFVDTSSSSAARISIIVVAVLVFILAAAFVVWKLRENQTKDTKLHHEAETGNREREQLMAEEQKKEEEQKDLVKTLTEQRKELQNQEDKLKQQSKDMEKNIEDIENKLQSVEKMPGSEQCCELKEIILMAKKQLLERKHGDEQLYLETRTLKNKTNVLLNTMTGQDG